MDTPLQSRSVAPVSSVLIVTWNHEKYIAQAVQSAIDQSADDLEIIFLDNCSADRTADIAEELLRASGRSHTLLRNESPRGVVDNFNRLYEASSGKYLFPISGDDWFHKDMVKKKVAFLETHPEVGLLSSGGWIYYDDTGEYEEMDQSKYLRGNICREVMNGIGVFNFVGCCYRRSVLEDVGLWDPALLIEDLDMFVRIGQKYKIDFLEEPLVYYRKNKNAISNNTDHIVRGWEQYHEKYKSAGWINMDKWLAERYRMYAATQIDNKRFPEAAELLRKSFRKNPLNPGLLRTLWYYLRSKRPA